MRIIPDPPAGSMAPHEAAGFVYIRAEQEEGRQYEHGRRHHSGQYIACCRYFRRRRRRSQCQEEEGQEVEQRKRAMRLLGRTPHQDARRCVVFQEPEYGSFAAVHADSTSVSSPMTELSRPDTEEERICSCTYPGQSFLACLITASGNVYTPTSKQLLVLPSARSKARPFRPCFAPLLFIGPSLPFVRSSRSVRGGRGEKFGQGRSTLDRLARLMHVYFSKDLHSYDVSHLGPCFHRFLISTCHRVSVEPPGWKIASCV